MAINEAKRFIFLALPLICAFLAQKGMQLIDTIMMGWIGPQALAAAALGTTVYFLIVVFCQGTLSAVGVSIMHARGANQPDEIRKNIQQSIYLVVILAIPAMLIIWYAPHIILSFKQDPAVVANMQLLLQGLVWGLPGYLLFLVFREIISAFSLGKVVMLVNFISLPLTFFINYILIYGKCGLPAYGIAGIGYSGAIVMWFMFLCLLVYTSIAPTTKNYITFNFIGPNFHKVKELLFLGAPSGGIFVLDLGMFLVAAIMIGSFGVIPLAAYQIVMQCASLAYNIPLAMSMVTALQVGLAVGSGDMQKIRQAIYISFSIGLIVSLIIAAAFLFIPEELISLFINPSTQDYGQIRVLTISFLAFAAFFATGDAIQAIANGVLRGFKDSLASLYFSLPCYWGIGLGSAYYLAFHLHLKANGVWYGIILGVLSGMICLIIRVLKRLRSSV